jgi:hypothetical protein
MLMYEFNANQHTSLCQGWGKRPAIGAVSQLNHNLHCCSVGGNSNLIRVVMTHPSVARAIDSDLGAH